MAIRTTVSGIRNIFTPRDGRSPASARDFSDKIDAAGVGPGSAYDGDMRGKWWAAGAHGSAGDGGGDDRPGAACAMETGRQCRCSAGLSARERQMVDKLVGGLPPARRRLLAAERSRRPRALQIDRRHQSQAAAHDHGQPLGPARREPSVHRLRTDAAGPRTLPQGSHARRDREVRPRSIPPTKPRSTTRTPSSSGRARD